MSEVPSAVRAALVAVLALLALAGGPARAEGETVGSSDAEVRAQADQGRADLPGAGGGEGEIVVAVTAGLEDRRAFVAIGVGPGGGQARTLELTLSEGSGTRVTVGTPIIVACPVADAFEAGHLDEGPAADCTQPIAGRRGDEGRWFFELTPLLDDAAGEVRVALVPRTQPADTWRVGFETSATAARLVVGGSSAPAWSSAWSDTPHGFPGTSLAPAGAGGEPLRLAPLGSDPPASVAGPSLVDGSPPAAPRSATARVGLTPPSSGASAPPSLLVVLAAAGGGALGLITPPGSLARLTRWARSRQEEIKMTLEELATVRRRVRLAVGGTGLVGLVLVAALTATPPKEGSDRRTALPVLGSGGVPDAAGGSVDAGGGIDAVGGGASGDPGDATAAGPASAAAAGRAGGGKAGGGSGRAASDQGVTATEIRVASLVVAPAFYARFGIPDPELERAIVAFTDEINAGGGINGRKVIPELVTVTDPRDRTATATACRTAFTDRKAFMALNANAYPGLAACAADHGRIATDLGFGPTTATPAAEIAALGGRYWTGAMSTDRFVRLWAQYLAATYGRRTRIGMIQNSDETLGTVGDQLRAALTEVGFDGRYSVVVSEPDPSTATLQAANAIAQWKRDGVELVVPLTNAIAVGIVQRSATAQGWRPSKGWTFSSIAAVDSADTAQFLDPEQMAGAKGISFVRGPDEPEQKACRAIYARRQPGRTFNQATGDLCHMIFQNAHVLRRAGTELTVTTWAAAYAGLGTYDGNALGRQTYAATKRDGADSVRAVAYESGRFRPVGPFRSGF